MTGLDDRLRSALQDDLWALEVPLGSLDRVRSGHRARRRRTGACVAVGMLVLAGGAAGLLSHPPRGEPTAQLGAGVAAPVVPRAPRAVPGISPPFVPVSGRDWLTSPAQHAAFVAAHTGAALASGPYPTTRPDPTLTPADLAHDVGLAGLPAGTTLRTTALDGEAHLTATLPSGVLVDVRRYHATIPFIWSFDSSGHPTAPDPSHYVVVDVPETSAAAGLTSGVSPYGFPNAAPGAADANGDHSPDVDDVVVVDAQGVTTDWHAYTAVPLGQLQLWAFTTAQRG